MKKFVIAALGAFFACSISAQASTLGVYVTATDEQLGVPTNVNVSFVPIFDEPDFEFTVTSVDVSYGDEFSETKTQPLGASTDFFYIYSAANTYTVLAIVHGYFTGSSDATTYDFGNGTTVHVTGFTDITPTPIPAALPLLATGLGGLGLAAWRKRAMKS